MGFFRRKREESVYVHQVPLTAFIRQMVYDSLLDPPEQIAAHLGLPPISEELSEKEQDASEERLSQIEALIPLLDAHSDVASRMCGAAYNIRHGDGEMTKEELDSFINLFKVVSFASTLSAVSTLVEIGAVVPTTVAVSNDN